MVFTNFAADLHFQDRVVGLYQYGELVTVQEFDRQLIRGAGSGTQGGLGFRSNTDIATIDIGMLVVAVVTWNKAVGTAKAAHVYIG